MLKAGADAAATGENPVVVNARDADVICGPMGILTANALWGNHPGHGGGGQRKPGPKGAHPREPVLRHRGGRGRAAPGEYVRLAVQAAKEQLEEK